MPDGIVRDPKQNPRERDFGIVYINDLGGNFRYQKTRSRNRFLVAGDIVQLIIPNDSSIEYYPIIRTIDGIPIIGEIKNLDLTPITNGDNAPVIYWYKTTIGSQMNEAKMDELMRGKSDLIT